jgi:hypothetical protein
LFVVRGEGVRTVPVGLSADVLFVCLGTANTLVVIQAAELSVGDRDAFVAVEFTGPEVPLLGLHLGYVLCLEVKFLEIVGNEAVAEQKGDDGKQKKELNSNAGHHLL